MRKATVDDFKKIKTKIYKRDEVEKTYRFEEKGEVVTYVPGYFMGLIPVSPFAATYMGDAPTISYSSILCEKDGLIYQQREFGDIYELGDWDGSKPVNKIITCIDDIKKLRVLDPIADGKVTDEMRRRAKEVKQNYWIAGWIPSLDHLLNWPCGLSQLIEWITFEPALINAANEYLTKVALNFIRAYAQMEYDEISTTACFGSNSILSPKMFKDVTDEFHRTICSECHKYGMKVKLHQCGNSVGNWETIIDQGFDAFETVDPLGGCRLSDAKKVFDKKVVVFGNVSTDILAFGTPEEVKKETLRSLEEGMPGGGYVLGLGDTTVSRVTPVENILTVVEVAEKYGRYS